MEQSALLAATLACAVLLVLRADAACGQEAPNSIAEKYLQAVQTFADKALAHGRDVYGPKQTPLFVDGLNVETLQPVQWHYDGQVWTLVNGTSQQVFFRTLVGLSNLTGQDKYRQAAVEALRYTFDHLRAPNGLIYWGGHCCYDAQGDRPVGRPSMAHELKCFLPCYQLMWEADPQATKKYLEAVWAGHVIDWSNLDMDRHAPTRDFPRTKPWTRSYKGGKVFFEGKGRTFNNIGIDLQYAGAWYYKLTGSRPALEWSRRLAQRYVETRNPATGLRGYQYSYPPPDRANEQFGRELPGHLVLEGTILKPTWYAMSGVVQLKLGELLGEEGREFVQWAHEDLSALGKCAYDARDNAFRPMLTDGLDLTGFVKPRDGYYGRKGSTFQATEADCFFLWAYVLAYDATRDQFMWEMARRIALANGLGDIGRPDGAACRLDLDTACCDGEAVFALLELRRITGQQAFLEQARRIGDNILKERFINGFFLPGADYLYASFNAVEPLALLHLAAALRGSEQAVPDWWGGSWHFACEIRHTDPRYTYDRRVVYQQRKSAAGGSKDAGRQQQEED